jgi:hypothetical protein
MSDQVYGCSKVLLDQNDAQLAQYALQNVNREGKYRWSHEGWDVTFEPIPKGEGARGSTSGRPIIMMTPHPTRKDSKRGMDHANRHQTSKHPCRPGMVYV